MSTEPPKTLDPIINLLKRRGFLFPSAELYGGASGLYDLGPLGTQLNSNIKARWWWRFVQLRDDMLGLDSSILTPAPVLKASGHVDTFADPLIECEKCHIRLRSDHFLDEDTAEVFQIRWRDAAIGYRKIGEKRAAEEAEQAWKGKDEGGLTCPNCGEKAFGEPRMFNMMFKTSRIFCSRTHVSCRLVSHKLVRLSATKLRQETPFSEFVNLSRWKLSTS